MFEGSDSLPMFDLILAAAETLSQREAASASEELDPLGGFEQVWFQEHGENVSTASGEASGRSADPLFSNNHHDMLFHEDLAVHNLCPQLGSTDSNNMHDTENAQKSDTEKLTDLHSVVARPLDNRSNIRSFKNRSSQATHSVQQTGSEYQKKLAYRCSQRTSKLTIRHVRSASIPGYSLYPNLSSSNNISHTHGVYSTTVSGEIMNNQPKIQKKTPVPNLKKVQATVERGSTNQNYSEKTWNSQGHQSGRVASIDVSNYSTTQKRAQLPHFDSPLSAPWENLSNPGPNRVALADVSNSSMMYGGGRLPPVRDSCASHGNQPHQNPYQDSWANVSGLGVDRTVLRNIANQTTIHARRRVSSIRLSYDYLNQQFDEYPSFQRVQASTPIMHTSFALDLSLHENSIIDTPLDLVLAKPIGSTDQRPSTMVLDLRKKNTTAQHCPTACPQLTKANSDIPCQTSQECIRSMTNSSVGPPLCTGNVDAVDSEEDFTDDEIDPDWVPDGDATRLDDLSIYEYFEKFRNEICSDSEMDAPESDEMELNEEVHNGVPQPKKSKGTMRQVNKNCKTKGLPYKRADGSVVPARRIQPPCNCKMRCQEKFSEIVRKSLLARLLELTQSGQNQFLSSHITVINTVRPKVLVSRRTWSRIYKLPGVGGAVKVCKNMFMATFDIKERKVRVLADKLILGAGIAKDDMRKDNHSHRQLSSEHANYIMKHIKSFPAEESHYGREKSSCLYLSSDLTVMRMYELYQDQCGADNLIPAHYNTYRLAFKSLKLKFRKPKVDTCNTCDMLSIELKTERDAIKRDEILTRKESHQSEAESMYSEKRLDRQRANEDISVRTISFDLQKQLATPYLTCGRAFYSRQLYTYNLTIFETQAGANVPMCFMWDETRAKRGSKEIGSCLWEYLKALPSCVEEVVMYSDRCAGQNNNRTILFLMAYVVEMMALKGRRFILTHKFMSSGHSHMECDTIHSAIERAKKRTKIDIDIPSDWNIFIASIKRKTPIIVKDMDQKSFLNWLVLNERYVLPKLTTDDELFKFKSAKIFTCSTDHPGTVSLKTNVDATSKKIKLLSSQSVPLLQLQLKPITTVPIQLPTAKVEDLRKLLPFVTKKWYYEAFLKSMNAPGRGKKAKVADKGFDEDMDTDEDRE